MVPEGDKLAQRDWKDGGTYRHLLLSDRIELDLAFARRHAERLALTSIPVEDQLIRKEPRIRFLTHISSKWPCCKWVIRFRRSGEQR